jgi:hypothetical protein
MAHKANGLKFSSSVNPNGARVQGCQIFLGTNIKPKRKNIYQTDHLTNWPPKVYQFWNFWLENITSGNPDSRQWFFVSGHWSWNFLAPGGLWQPAKS